MTPTTATEPTIAEQLLALETTAHRLATERDHALAEHADLLEANCYLQQETNRARSRVRVGIDVNRHLRGELDARNRDVQRLVDENYRLALRCSDLEQQTDRDQQQPAPQRRFFRRRRRT